MKAIWKMISQQPVATMFVVSQGIGLGMAFGLDWSAEQAAMVNGFVAAVLSLIVWQKVSPV